MTRSYSLLWLMFKGRRIFLSVVGFAKRFRRAGKGCGTGGLAHPSRVSLR